MYKCTDCGKEYETKPQYCDCGNITFEEIITPSAKETESGINEKREEKENIKNIKPVPRKRKEVKNQEKIDMPSLTIFIFCIILSVLSLIFIGRENPNKPKEQIKSSNANIKTERKNIPSVSALWVEAPIHSQPSEIEQDVKTSENEVKKVQTKQEQKQNVQPTKQTSSTNNQAKKVQKQQNQTQKQKQTQSAQQKRTAPKPKTQAKQQTTQKPQTPVQQKVQTSKPTQTNSNNSQNIIPQIKPITPSVPKTDPILEKKELLNYKIQLRDKITRDINFSRIIGDGTCIVGFKIDNNGNLISRSFIKQSQNDSLNDQVYNAIMNNPMYNPPPSGYKKETLKFTVKINGNTFAVDLN